MERIDIRLDSNFHLDFWGALAGLRGKEGRIGCDCFKELPWTVIVLIPPKGFIHAAMGFSQKVCSSALAWQMHEDTEDTYKSFIREFRNRGVPKSNIPSDWLYYYGSFERYAGKYAGLWKFKRFFDAQNARSIVVPSKLEDHFVDLLTREEDSLGQLAYLSAPDGTTLDKWRTGDRRAETYEENMRRWPFRSMLGVVPYVEGCSSVWRPLMEEVIAYLRYAVKSLENGKFPDLPLDPVTVCGPSADLLSSSCSMPPDDRELESLCLALRARLVRLMKWPHMVHAVTTALDAHRLGTELCVHHPHSIPSPTIPCSDRLPYDPVSELNAYLVELNAAFPWVMEDPFTAPSHHR